MKITDKDMALLSSKEQLVYILEKRIEHSGAIVCAGVSQGSNVGGICTDIPKGQGFWQ
jgi:hypothetical protein